MKIPPYALTLSVEPHAARRKALLARHPEIKDRYGYDSWSVAIMLGAVSAQLLLAFFVQMSFEATHGSLGWWLATIALTCLVGSVLSHWASMFSHEATHNNTASTVEANKMWSMVSNIGQGLPSAMSFRKYHPRHHGNLGTYGTDAVLPADWEVGNLKPTRLIKGLWVMFLFLFWVARGVERSTAPTRDEYVNLALIVGVNALLVYTMDGWRWLICS